jgi:hypothetical protein
MKYTLLILLTIPMVVFADAGDNVATDWALKIVQYGSSVIGFASMIAAITPTKKDNAAIAILRAVIDALAFNFGNAKNKN